MRMQESGEMYLETILVLSRRGQVRAIDISASLGYSKPSVSRAVGLLKGDGYILVDKEGFITLTPSGQAIAQKILERHEVLTRMLIALGVDAEDAQKDACRMEHAISDSSFEAIKRHVNAHM